MEKIIELTVTNQDAEWEKVRIATSVLLIFTPIIGFICWIAKDVNLFIILATTTLVSSLITTIYATILLQKRFTYVETNRLKP
jgi:hypothetical protein